MPLSAKKPWISPHTLALISDFQNQTFEDLTQLKSACKIIKKAARKDKKLFISHHLEKDFHGSNIHQWDQIRSIRSDFKPKAAASLYNLQDRLVSTSSRAPTFADYLAKKIWFSETDPNIPVANPHPPVSIDAPFTMHELTLALHHYNQCLSSATVPSDWLFSEVVMIVKKYSKDTRLLSNYRPISLTNISYKFSPLCCSHGYLISLMIESVPPNLDSVKIDLQLSPFTFSVDSWRSMKDSLPLFTPFS